jgi:hypothetical protein
MRVDGPALVVEPQTTTNVLRGFTVGVAPGGALVLEDRA